MFVEYEDSIVNLSKVSVIARRKTTIIFFGDKIYNPDKDEWMPSRIEEWYFEDEEQAKDRMKTIKEKLSTTTG